MNKKLIAPLLIGSILSINLLACNSNKNITRSKFVEIYSEMCKQRSADIPLGSKYSNVTNGKEIATFKNVAILKNESKRIYKAITEPKTSIDIAFEDENCFYNYLTDIILSSDLVDTYEALKNNYYRITLSGTIKCENEIFVGTKKLTFNNLGYLVYYESRGVLNNKEYNSDIEFFEYEFGKIEDAAKLEEIYNSAVKKRNDKIDEVYLEGTLNNNLIENYLDIKNNFGYYYLNHEISEQYSFYNGFENYDAFKTYINSFFQGNIKEVIKGENTFSVLLSLDDETREIHHSYKYVFNSYGYANYLFLDYKNDLTYANGSLSFYDYEERKPFARDYDFINEYVFRIKKRKNDNYYKATFTDLIGEGAYYNNYLIKKEEETLFFEVNNHNKIVLGFEGSFPLTKFIDKLKESISGLTIDYFYTNRSLFLIYSGVNSFKNENQHFRATMRFNEVGLLEDYFIIDTTTKNYILNVLIDDYTLVNKTLTKDEAITKYNEAILNRDTFGEFSKLNYSAVKNGEHISSNKDVDFLLNESDNIYYISPEEQNRLGFPLVCGFHSGGFENFTANAKSISYELGLNDLIITIERNENSQKEKYAFELTRGYIRSSVITNTDLNLSLSQTGLKK